MAHVADYRAIQSAFLQPHLASHPVVHFKKMVFKTASSVIKYLFVMEIRQKSLEISLQSQSSACCS